MAALDGPYYRLGVLSRLSRASLLVAFTLVSLNAVAEPSARHESHGKHHRHRRTASVSKGQQEKRHSKPQSVGSPAEGKLEGGVHLPQDKDLRVIPFYSKADHLWGLPDLVHLVKEAAHKVSRTYPGSRLQVGELSKKGGGDIERHKSHESGRDADLGFYLTSAKGDQLEPPALLKVDEEGHVEGHPGAHFDTARNWALVSALLSDPDATVQEIFVAPYLRARLLSYAALRHASMSTRNRAAMILMQPKDALLHDDHFHVRIACPHQEAHGVCVDYLPRKAKHQGHSPAEADRKHDAESHKKSGQAHDSSHEESSRGAKHDGSHSHQAGTTGTQSNADPPAHHGDDTAPGAPVRSKPTIATGRRRGSSSSPAVPAAGVVQAPDGDFDDSKDDPSLDQSRDEAGEPRIAR